MIPLGVCDGAIAAFREAFVRTGRTDAAGEAAVSAVAPGVYAVAVETSGGPGAIVGPVELVAKSNHLRIRRSEGAELRGTVVFPSGESPRPGRVQALWIGNGGRFHASETILQGQATAWGIPDVPHRGTVWVRASTRDGWTSPLAVVHDAALLRGPLTLTMIPPRPWRGMWAGTTEAARYMAATTQGPFGPPGPTLFERIITDSDGRFTVPGVPVTADLVWFSGGGAGVLVEPIGDRRPGELGEVAFPTEGARPGPSSGDTRGAGWGPYEIRVEPVGDEPARELDFVEVQSASNGDERPHVGHWFARVRNDRVRLPFGEPAPGGLVAGHPGCGSAVSPVRSGKVEPAPRLPVLGSVVDPSGSGVAGAEVEIRPAAEFPETAQLARVLHADAEGTWRWAFAGRGVWDVTAAAAGYLPGSARITVSAKRRERAFTITLHRAGRVEGRVFGLPAESEATIRMVERDAGIRPKQWRVGVAEGETFAFDDVPPGRYHVLVRAGDASSGSEIARSAECRVLEGETAYVDFNLGAGVLLSGTVYLSEDIVPGAMLAFDRTEPRREDKSTAHAATTANEQGRYSVALPGAGTYQVVLRKQSSHLLGQTRLKISVGDEAKQKQDLRFPAGMLRGRLVTRDGDPVPRAQLWLFQKASGGEHPPVGSGGTNRLFLARGESEADGEFEFAGLASGDYFLGVEAKGFARRTLGPIQVQENQEVELPEVVLVQEASITVAVSGPTGEPLSGAVVGAFAGGDLRAAAAPPSAVTGSDGTAVIPGLAPGTYTLVALFRDLAPALADGIEIGGSGAEKPISLSLSAGGILEVHISSTSGAPVAGAGVELTDAEGRDVTGLYENLALLSGRPARTDDQGVLRIQHMAPGAYLARVAPPLAGEPEQVAVSESQITLVQIYGVEASGPQERN